MSNVRNLQNWKDGPVGGSVERRVEQSTLQLIRTLVDSLPPEAREQLARELAQAELAHEAKPSGVLATIISLLPPHQTVTVAELKQQVVERGVEADPKEIYNAIGYLARKGKLRRIGYGRYLVDGMEIATSDDFGGPNSRHEDPYRTDPGEEG